MKHKLTLILLALSWVFCLVSFEAQAVEPDEMLSDPKLEARARAISTNLRCLVCQNQSIDDSHADLAKDLRILVRERLTKGDTDEQAIGYIVDRYGEYVLLKPRMSAHTLILWFGPLVLLLLAGGYFLLNLRARPVLEKKGKSGVKALSSEEAAALAKLMDKD